MANKLYVGNLSYSTTNESLQAAFSECGTVVEAQVIIDRMSGRSKGFGFVTMETDDQARAAIDRWNEQELDGRALKVNEARPMEDRPRRTGGGGGYQGGGSGGYQGGGNSGGGNWSS